MPGDDNGDNTIAVDSNSAHDVYRIALYYCYIPLHDSDVDGIVELHTSWRSNHHSNGRRRLGGRIRVAGEGLNGVLSGFFVDLMDYEDQLRSYLTSLDESSSDVAPSWELDVKYCHLRPELSVRLQLFDDLQVDRTSSVVGLVDMNGYCPDSNEDENQTIPRRGSGGYSSRRRLKKRINKDQHNAEQNARAQDIFYRSLHDDTHDNIDSGASPTTGSAVVPHLSPTEWDDKLVELSARPDANVVLLDCRNSYESAIGYFVALPQALQVSPKDVSPTSTASTTSSASAVCTVLTNTRKYSELPAVLMNQVDQESSALGSASHIFMYCTGGVRCERASAFLKTLLLDKCHEEQQALADSDDKATVKQSCRPLPEIYQLHGGIQKYLEVSSQKGASSFKGKNFVFDPRRTDPTVASSSSSSSLSEVTVGRCLVCSELHDDYDNGHAPMANMEARCYKCRVLILVCNACRTKVTCWGEASLLDRDDHDAKTTEPQPLLPRLYCGGLEPKECLHMPPVQVIRS